MVAAYADEYFEYDSDQRVTWETVEAGARTFTFAYTASGNGDGYNNWHRKTVETLPDESQNIVYTNYIGQVLVQEFRSGADRWIEYRRYDEDGRLVLHAQPSACEGYDDTQADLGGETGVLRTADGLVHLYEYYGPEASSKRRGRGPA